MLKTLFIEINPLLLLILFTLLIVKPVHFALNKNRKWGPRRFLYFTSKELRYSEYSGKDVAKRMQNLLSISILFIMICYTTVFIFSQSISLTFVFQGFSNFLRNW